jgi:hypothetical protein
MNDIARHFDAMTHLNFYFSIDERYTPSSNGRVISISYQKELTDQKLCQFQFI